MVLKPTSTPLTSVMALYLPGVPSKGIPISLALGFCAYAIVWMISKSDMVSFILIVELVS
jgi:hypothetical protein